MCHERTYVPRELFLVVADTANLISDLISTIGSRL